MTTTTDWTLDRTTGPSVLPLTLADAKGYLNLREADTTHDGRLTRAIGAATEQFEKDTSRVVIQQGFRQYRNEFPDCDTFQLYPEPIAAVDGISYTNDDGVQTLATSVYGFDKPRRHVYLKTGQSWPDTTAEINNVVVTFTAGYAVSPAVVPRLIQEALLIQTAMWFYYDPSINTNHSDQWHNAYERLITRLMRSTYP